MSQFAPHPARRPTLIAGASSGIGAATAAELAARGFPVALGARRLDMCEEVAARIRADGGEAVALPLDVTDPASVTRFAEQAAEALGDIEVLVAGAGDTFFGRLHETGAEEFEAQIQVHLIGANRLAAAVLPGMVRRQRGDAIFIGSAVALRPRPHMGGYGAAKAGLLAMVANLQMELEGTGVRASVVHPGRTQTGMAWGLPPESIAAALRDWARWGHARHANFLRAADLARAIAFIAETPRGGFVASLEMQPEAPLSDEDQRHPGTR